MKKSLLILCPALMFGCGGSGSSTSTTTVAKQLIASGLNEPIQYKSVPGVPNLAYVLERGGIIKVLDADVLQPTPLINVSSLLSPAGEGGLLGMAFDPNFGTNRHIYLYFTTGADLDTQVMRFTANPGFLTADISTGFSIIKIGQAPYGNHKGGTINFGGDGKLYLAMGDGGSGNDPLNRSQDKTTLLGKMLRIDLTGDAYPADADNNYSIPAGNPFLSDATVRPEIWAFGLRNPFRWTYDAVLDGFFLADVGQDSYEEVNFVAQSNAGRNFGWRVREGKHSITNPGPTFGTSFTDPFVEFGRPDGRSVSGGHVYRGTAIPSLTGRYVVADFVTNRFWAVPITMLGSEVTSTPTPAPITITGGLNGTVSVDPDAGGEAIVSEMGSGTVSRLVPVPIP